jgi:hypothetical protein
MFLSLCVQSTNFGGNIHWITKWPLWKWLSYSVCQYIYQGVDIVEGLASSKTEEPTSTVSIRWARNVGTPLGIVLPPVSEKKYSGWWWCTWIDRNLIIESLGMSGLKEGAVVAVGELSLRERPSHKKMSQAETSEKKERWYTDKLCEMNSLKEGAMWWNMTIC